MDDVATKIVEILKKHMKEPRDDINESTALADLQIESLDLAMIVFEIREGQHLDSESIHPLAIPVLAC